MDLKLLRRQIYSPMDTPQTAVSQFVRNCLLFSRLPIDFLLTFQDSKDIVPAVKPINKEAHIVGMAAQKIACICAVQLGMELETFLEACTCCFVATQTEMESQKNESRNQ